MPKQSDDEWQARLSHLVKHGSGDDLDEMARLLGQHDPNADPGHAAPREKPPGIFARMLELFWRPR